ncbi:MAG: hypothetical protein HC930_11385 [Hydrococcus sp. SU_1_0]|nr:hypothetical protein [Hydrococcus sp. SU_1_0]
MHHNTYDRFSGCWWGGIIGQCFIPKTQVSASLTWLPERREIGQVLLNQLSAPDFDNFLTIQSASNSSGQAESLNHHSNLLSCLPLIIFPSNQYSLTLKTKQNQRLISKDSYHYLFVDEELLIWSYVLNMILNQQFDSLTPKIAIEQIVKFTQVTESPLISKLQLVSQEIQTGNSLVQVTDELSSSEHLLANAIALAWYCFATTPRDFKLSVQKASHLESKLGWLTTALTATLSGAYNGMAVISRGWTIDQEQDWCWQLEDQLLLKLFKHWLGVYTVEGDYESYNLKLDAIAPPKFIQLRRHSKKIIISQNLKNKQFIIEYCVQLSYFSIFFDYLISLNITI